MTFDDKKQKYKRKRLRQAKAKEDYARYKEQQTAYEYGRKAVQIIWALSKVSYAAKSLCPGDIVCKVHSGQELDFYHRWCCNVL